MKRVVVRYKAKPDKVVENIQLIENVYEALRASSPPGIRYATFKLADGTFVHVSETEDSARPLPELDAFRRFVSGIKERCIEPPQSEEAVLVGNYRMVTSG
jgi:hypothetical protein